MVTRIDSVQDVLSFLETVSPRLAAQCAAEIETVWKEIAELEDELEPKLEPGGPATTGRE